MSKLIDLSHTIEDGLITYQGLPAPHICDFLSREASRELYDEGTEFHIGKIEMVANTGTYLDCPFHRYADGMDTSEILLNKLVDLEAVVVRAPHGNQLSIDRSFFEGKNIKGKTVLVNTGWDAHWNTDKYYQEHPYLTEDAALYIRSQEVKLVGIDSYNIDDTSTRRRPVHTILLREEILIVEHMCNLHLLPDEDFTFTAVPPKIKGMGTFPVRAFGKIYNLY